MADLTLTASGGTLSLFVATGSGEANTGANVGAGDAEVFKDKTSAVLNFRTITGIGDVAVAENGDVIEISVTAGGTGDVVGPASATDNALARYNTTTGKLIQNSLVTVDDAGSIATPGFTVGSGGTLSSLLNVPFSMTSAKTDSATAVGFDLATDNAFSTAGAELLRISNGSTKLFSFDSATGVKGATLRFHTVATENSIEGSFFSNLIYRATAGHDFRTHTGGAASGSISTMNVTITSFLRGVAPAIGAEPATGAEDADVLFTRFVSNISSSSLDIGVPFFMSGTHLTLNQRAGVVADGVLEDSRILRFRAGYDSDPTAGVVDTEFDANIQHIMLTGGAAPTSKLSFLVNSAERLVLPSAAPVAYTRNATVVEDRTLLASASATTINNNNVLAALIADLQARALIG